MPHLNLKEVCYFSKKRERKHWSIHKVILIVERKLASKKYSHKAKIVTIWSKLNHRKKLAKKKKISFIIDHGLD